MKILRLIIAFMVMVGFTTVPIASSVSAQTTVKQGQSKDQTCAKHHKKHMKGKKQKKSTTTTTITPSK